MPLDLFPESLDQMVEAQGMRRAWKGEGEGQRTDVPGAGAVFSRYAPALKIPTLLVRTVLGLGILNTKNLLNKIYKTNEGCISKQWGKEEISQ